jgi:hypothetical protein
VQRRTNLKYGGHVEVEAIPDLNTSILISLLTGKTFDVVVFDGSGNFSDSAAVLSSELAADELFI